VPVDVSTLTIPKPVMGDDACIARGAHEKNKKSARARRARACQRIMTSDVASVRQTITHLKYSLCRPFNVVTERDGQGCEMRHIVRRVVALRDGADAHHCDYTDIDNNNNNDSAQRTHDHSRTL
jgi:hypothetical protein